MGPEGLRSPRVAAALSRSGDAGLAAAEAADAAAVHLAGGCDLAVVFASPDHVAALPAVAAAVEARLEPGALIGAVAQGVVGPGEEVEAGPAVAVWAAHLSPGRARAFRTWAIRTADGGMAVAGWPDTRPDQLTVLLADPFSFPAADVARRLGEERPGHHLSGGLLTAGAGRSRLLIDGEVHDDGAVGVVLEDVAARAVVAQGCVPVGEPLAVTAAEHNRILELAGAPATQRLEELLQEADAEMREHLRAGGLQVGLVVDTLQDSYDRGDFLVRGVLDVDPDGGGVTIGELVHVGQVVQFHVRDAAGAGHDLRERLDGVEPSAGSLLFTCNGRGRRLFGRADHDVSLVEATLGGAVAGAFCAGELGPVGPRSYLHGFTASLTVFLGGAQAPGAVER